MLLILRCFTSPCIRYYFFSSESKAYHGFYLVYSLMANKNPPAHDFAPAWLKIPTYDNYKPSGALTERGRHTSRRDEHSFSYSCHSKESDNLVSHHPYFNDSRKDRNDFDDSFSFTNAHYYGVDNSFNGSCNNQSVLSRRPHSRHDFRISVSCSKADNLAKHMTNNGSGFYSHKGKGGKLNDSSSSSSSSSNNGVNEGRGIGVNSNNFNQEFPSLQGDISEESTTPPPTLNGSAWEKPHTIKIHNAGIGKKIQLVKKPSKTEILCENSRKSPASSSSGALTTSSSSISSISNPHTLIVTPTAKGSSVYRALIPAKNTLIKKSPRDGLKLINKKSSITPPPPTHSMEILVKHPKAPGNKSEFLKTLRNEKKEIDENEREYPEKNNCNTEAPPIENHEENHVNGIDVSKITLDERKDKVILSSSLEAEERLLRQMGWRGEDEIFAPLTEDELRELRDRSEKIIKKNGIRRNLLANLSPLRIAQFPTVPPPTETTSSSSESDSDF